MSAPAGGAASESTCYPSYHPEFIPICYNRRSLPRSVATGTANLHSLAARQARGLQSDGLNARCAFQSTASNRAHVKFLVNFLERRA
jgi:hypothetical protein